MSRGPDRARARRRRVGWRAGLSVVLATVLAVSGTAPARADTVRDLEYWLNDYGFTTAWNTSRGEGVTVAIIDTGVNGEVAELAGVVIGGTDVSGLGSDDGQTPVGEESEHGTMVASLLAGRGTGEGNGVIGVAPDAELLTASVAFGQDTGSDKTNDEQIAEAVRWAVDNGADVINMSLTRNTRDWPESWDDAFTYAFENDVVVVAAAGNRGSGTSEVGAPATIPGVLAVAGVDREQNASFDASAQGITLAVSAPSEDLVGVLPDGSYVQWSGTSAAAPLVSGLVALVRSAYPELDAANVINRVIRTADPKGEEVPSPLYGYGIIDPVAALTAEVELVEANPLGSLADWIRVHRRADLPAEDGGGDDAQEIVPIADPPPPRSDSAKTLLPTAWTLAYITVPLSLVAGFGTLAALLGIGATRHIRRTSRTGTR
ncbi:type VII secretion-associated serine protease mycosin [Agromyces flavus]|uniref:Type VII secretion-associated serine protease mycosin n=1 Tax=Agromyces flavus TaxID=589382 RepID=A0ABT1KQU6_9MICO|nr:S8 family serine peptidase [Agromyces flavus]MCP2369183.1 type VII secretion-associated serine protease mycosin [Agromyces flavus]